MRNGVDYEHFATAGPRLPSPSVVVGYYGAISHWFDSRLVAHLARLRPDWRFELVGNTYQSDLRPLLDLPNVRLLGEMPYADIPRRMAEWHACIIPFLRNELTEATNPVKVYEMLAAGMPVVSVDLPELRPMARAGLIELADDAAGFAEKIAKLLSMQTPETIARGEILPGGIRGPIAIGSCRRPWRLWLGMKRVLLGWQPLGWQLNCHPSKLLNCHPSKERIHARRGEHENIGRPRHVQRRNFLGEQLRSLADQERLPDELVVCDDGSTDETIDMLRQFADESPFETRLEIHPKNLGASGNFARAVSLCRGEAIALCDQDDVWLPNKLQRIERCWPKIREPVSSSAMPG